MASVNLEGRIPILVVDPNNTITERVAAVLAEGDGTRRWNQFEVERVNDISGIRLQENGPPEYGAIIYASKAVTRRRRKNFAKIRGVDPGLPQIIVEENGTEAKHRLEEQKEQLLRILSQEDYELLIEGRSRSISEADERAAREAGIWDYTRTTEGLRTIIDRQFKIPSRLVGGVVVKIGGSAFDYALAHQDDQALGSICDELTAIVKEKGNPRRTRILCTVGAGPRGDIAKHNRGKYPRNEDIQAAYPRAMAHALQNNLRDLYQLFGRTNGAVLRRGGDFHQIGRSGRSSKRVQLIATAPHYVMVRDGIPLEDSDTHTIALAEMFRIPTVVLVKRTDGIYDHCPYRGFVFDPEKQRCRNYTDWLEEQRGNRRHGVVTVEEMLSGSRFSRIGTGEDGRQDGTTGHLMEDSALEYMLTCRYVREIRIAHVAPGEMYIPIPRGMQHIAKGGTLRSDTNWDRRRREELRRTVKVSSYSRIVRAEFAEHKAA